MNMTNQHPMIQGEPLISIPIKITDGLFMSDHHIAQDVDFFETNQITHVINCAGKQITNSKNVGEVSFLTFQWSENCIQNITDQGVVSVVVGFIEECKRQHGCLLIHSYLSESRPFCLLTCYLMIKFKWNLFKTLEFLNSRKEDIELQPAFFQQLTSFHQKLQEKNLIRSRTWAVTDNMAEDQIILTNTYLNSKKRTPVQEQSMKKSIKAKTMNVSWKNDLTMEHSYNPQDIIGGKEKRISGHRERSDSAASKDEKERKKDHKSSIIQQKNTLSNVGEMNVTKKWAELREMWMKEKENQNSQNQSLSQQNSTSMTNSVNESKKATSIIVKKDNQRINDRLQEKLNLLKRYEPPLQPKRSEQKKKKSIGDANKENREPRENSIDEIKSIDHPQKSSSEKNSRTLHNNWIINNHLIKEGSNPAKNNSQSKNITSNPTNKSIIIVKPNQMSTNNGPEGPSRSSVRKMTGSQRKNQKDQSTNTSSKFFRDEGMVKGRCSSTKPQRKESPAGIGLAKNSSFKSKGKWKF